MDKEDKGQIIKFKVAVIQGREGLSVYINDYRVAGSKPWGGGTVLYENENADIPMNELISGKKMESMNREDTDE